ncbi:MAG: GNAT acetyltransferase 2-domain-containing protein [Lentinula lateritia]|uniref:RNA cytidine acetyltransferase n=1 Tax=Lentinula lateritia TaxID=40482 RepID=A0ABQ8VB21_9AGAR|nr:MAG: GNAT acetyltransferase 2-domain-containing protein [Lentinula lateritia]KAJ4484637.1 GNAT acetyltransferase 2-domain-containing protein [Lentinula lateritia]
MRKQLDPRIPILVNNNVTKNHRSFVVLVGDKGRDQIVNLHFLLSQARVSARPSVLWCYKKDLGFTTHRKKREAKIKRDVKRGIREPNDQDPFEIFVTVTDIRYTYYKESHKILGHTYGMLVLQDFEALTPNLLARTIETVEGGGLIVLLLKSMNSLRQLYTMGMDVHARYRTESSGEVKPRFNERFILSLAACPDCLFLDDELNVLPLSKGKDIEPLPEQNGKETTRSQENAELRELQNSLEGSVPAGPLVALAKTTDQARALLTFVNSLITPSDPSSSSNPSSSLSSALNTTTTLLAPRGRGKSSALGLALAAAVHAGYANIFLTSPAPENLQTAWEFLFKGLDALGWEEHLDYDILQATHDLSSFGNGVDEAAESNPTLGKGDGGKKPIVRVNIFRNPTHRQTIQYIDPRDAHVLGQAELLIIDEAAAIPLPVVRNLLGPAMAKGSASAGGYAVWLASTVNGYEGTGRSLSLKLIQQLRDNSSSGPPTKADSGKGNSSNGNRTLNEVKLSTPIRYAPGDEVEKWLNTLLCLDVSSSSAPSPFSTLPHPTLCTLYHIDRDTLFSFHPASEAFLQRIMSLYVASHYKNQPNDLQLMSDAPGHELYVLLPPINAENKEEADILPHPLAVIQIAFEGRISRESVLSSLSRGLRAGGDLIPWLITQQYQETKFAELSGARIVRVAVGEGVGGMGYGSRAINCLNAYFSGEYFNLDEPETESSAEINTRDDVREAGDAKKATLHTEKITVRAPNAMPPLLQRLSERRPEQLDYLGVSYGLTGSLLRFWKRLSFVPLYIRHTPSDLTGEHTCVMVRGLNSTTEVEMEWLGEFGADFRTRLLTLLSFPKFRDFGSVLGLSVLEAINNNTSIKAVDTRELQGGVKALTPALLPSLLTPFDLKRLESYGNNQLDYHVILDLLPLVATLFFQRRLNRPKSSEASGEVNNLSLSAVQSAILLGMGLQRKSVEELETELSLPVSQILAMLVKLILKITKCLKDVQKEGLTQSMPDHSTAVSFPSNDGPAASEGETWKNISATVEAELEAAGAEEKAAMKKRERQREMINSLDLRKYAIDNSSMDWSTAETQVAKIAGAAGKKSHQTVVSIKSVGSKRKASDTGDDGAKGVKKPTRRGKTAKR